MYNILSYMQLFSWCFSLVCHRYISAYVKTHFIQRFSPNLITTTSPLLSLTTSSPLLSPAWPLPLPRISAGLRPHPHSRHNRQLRLPPPPPLIPSPRGRSSDNRSVGGRRQRAALGRGAAPAGPPGPVRRLLASRGVFSEHTADGGRRRYALVLPWPRLHKAVLDPTGAEPFARAHAGVPAYAYYAQDREANEVMLDDKHLLEDILLDDAPLRQDLHCVVVIDFIDVALYGTITQGSAELYVGADMTVGVPSIC